MSDLNRDYICDSPDQDNIPVTLWYSETGTQPGNV